MLTLKLKNEFVKFSFSFLLKSLKKEIEKSSFSFLQKSEK